MLGVGYCWQWATAGSAALLLLCLQQGGGCVGLLAANAAEQMSGPWGAAGHQALGDKGQRWAGAHQGGGVGETNDGQGCLSTARCPDMPGAVAQPAQAALGGTLAWGAGSRGSHPALPAAPWHEPGEADGTVPSPAAPSTPSTSPTGARPTTTRRPARSRWCRRPTPACPA